MARIPNGILGVFIGRAGNITGYMRNGENFIRTRRTRTDYTATPKRLAQQQKIKVCNEFTRPFAGSGFFNATFPAYGDSGTGYNRATSALMNLAVTGTYPNTAISYPLVLISKGPLPVAENAGATAGADGNLQFKWTDNSGTGTAKINDKAVLVAYFPELNQVMYSLFAATRADEYAMLETSKMKGLAAETWLGFLSNDEKDASCSVYTGRVDL